MASLMKEPSGSWAGSIPGATPRPNFASMMQESQTPAESPRAFSTTGHSDITGASLSGMHGNIRSMIAQKEKELIHISQQRIAETEARSRELEESLREKDLELSTAKQQLTKLTTDFNYNLKLLEDRDAELERLDGRIAQMSQAAAKAEASLQETRNKLVERETEVKQQQTRLSEQDAYFKEFSDQTERRQQEREREVQEMRTQGAQQQKDLSHQREQATLQHKQLAASLEETQKAAEQECARKVAALEAANAQLAQQLDELTVAYQELGRTLVEQTTSAEQAKTALYEAESARKTAMTELEASTMAKEACVAQLEAELAEAKQQLTGDSPTAHALREAVAQHREEIQQYKLDLEEAHAQLRQAQLPRRHDQDEDEENDEKRSSQSLRTPGPKKHAATSPTPPSTQDPHSREALALRSQLREKESELADLQEQYDRLTRLDALGLPAQAHHAARALNQELLELRQQQEWELEERDIKQARQTETYFAALREDREAAAVLVTEADKRAARLEREGHRLRDMIGAEMGRGGSEVQHSTSFPASRTGPKLESWRLIDVCEEDDAASVQSENLSMRTQLKRLQAQLKDLKRQLGSGSGLVTLHEIGPGSAVDAPTDLSTENGQLRAQLALAEKELSRGRAELALARTANCQPRNTPAPQSPFLGSAPVWGDRASMSHAMSCPQLPHASARPGYDVERDGSMAAMSGDVGRGLYPPYPDEDSTGIGRARARILAAKAQLERLNHYSPSNMDFGGTTVRQDDVTFVCFNPPMLDQFAPLDV